MPYIYNKPTESKVEDMSNHKPTDYFETVYRIEVTMNKHPFMNRTNPYFWSLMSNSGGTWHSVGSNWSATPVIAFKDATEFYNKFIKGEK